MANGKALWVVYPLKFQMSLTFVNFQKKWEHSGRKSTLLKSYREKSVRLRLIFYLWSVSDDRACVSGSNIILREVKSFKIMAYSLTLS